MSRSTLVALALVVAFLSWSSLRLAAENAGLADHAARIERAGSAARTDDGRALKAWAVGSAVCDDAVNRAAATIALRAVAQANPATDYEKWWAALERTNDLLEHMATCSPHDGNIWANLALVRRAIVVPAEEISRLVHLSERLSPSETATIATRIEVWRGSPEPVKAVLGDVLDRDAARIRNYGWKEDVRKLDQTLGVEPPQRQTIPSKSP